MSGETHDSRTCQVCGERFDSLTEKGIHVSTAHDVRRTGGRDRTQRFLACLGPSCSERVYIGATCPTCGTVCETPEWSR